MSYQKKFFRKPVKKHAPFDMAQVATGIHIFCDGACEPNPGAGGWGYAVYRDGVEIAHGCDGLAETTNNVMELTGMLKAIEWVLHAFMKDKPVTIWCDSMYVVNGCNDWRHKWKRNGWSRKGPAATKPETGEVKNLDLWKAIDEKLNACTGLKISWVKGHNGTVGNERADELSLMGRQQAMAAAGIEEPKAVVDYLTAEYKRVMAG
ncbi:ribonuclease H family protein [Rhizobium sp. YTU87027]|uniref:ribonuclease H family protein n=1 Tax=Rhizobium sp. YTU87027 TaxID=3417741 RepID=UPI003D69F0C9